MKLNKYKLGELIRQVNEKNTDNIEPSSQNKIDDFNIILYDYFIQYADINSIDCQFYLKESQLFKMMKSVKYEDLEITFKDVQGNHRPTIKGLTFESFILFIKHLAYRLDNESFKANTTEYTHNFISGLFGEFHCKHKDKFMVNVLKNYAESFVLSDTIIKFIYSFHDSLYEI